MRLVETPVYDFTELSDAAKDKARAWFRQTIDDDWWDSVYDDFEQICPILGVTLATTPVRLMGGGTRQKPCIWFSGFWSQGDGACFELCLRRARVASHPRLCAPGHGAAPHRRRAAGAAEAELLSTDGLLPADRTPLRDDGRRRPRQPYGPADRQQR